MNKAIMKQARPWLVTLGLVLIWELSCRLFSVPGWPPVPLPGLVFGHREQRRAALSP